MQDKRLVSSTAAQNASEQAELESTFKKADSRDNAPSLSLRDAAEAVAWQSTAKNTNADSRENTTIQNKQAKNFGITKNAEILQSSNSTNTARRQDLGDKNGVLQGESREHTRAYVTADSSQQSPFLAPKPTPEPALSPKPTFYGVGDTLKTTYTKAEQYAIIAEVERRCKQYLDPSFDATSFIYPRDNFALTAEVESVCVFRQSLESTQAKPLFTIAIPTYKRVSLLRRAILSALAQDFDEPYEIIIVENPLEPTSFAAASMLQEFASSVTYYQNAQNIGGLGNWNRCLELACGKWVCLLHSDDELLPSYLSVMRSLATSPAYSHALLIGAIEEESQIYPRSALQRLYSKCISRTRLSELQMQASINDGFCALPPRALLHNRAKCIEIGGYDEEEAPSGDMMFFNRAALAGEVFCYRGGLLTRNHYEASSCKDPNVALMMILQNPQMFLAFGRRLTHAQIVGNHAWWSRYFAHLPLLKLYAQMRLYQQLKLFGARPSWQERSKAYIKEHCYGVFATLKAVKSLLTSTARPQESSVESGLADSSCDQAFMPPPPLNLLTSQAFVEVATFCGSISFARELESSKSAQKVDSMDCHALPSDNARNDRKNSAIGENLESSTNAPYPSSRAVRQHGVAIHNKKLDSSMDCHATATALARNDKNNNALDCHDFANAKSRNDSNSSAPDCLALLINKACNDKSATTPKLARAS